jgi:hypothetical protein
MIKKRKASFRIGKSTKNEKGSGQSKMSRDTDQRISARNATSSHRIDPLAHGTIIKGKTIMISPKGKGSST